MSSDFELRVLLLDGGKNTSNEVASTCAASGAVAEADDELLQLPNATNRHGRRAVEVQGLKRDREVDEDDDLLNPKPF